MLVFPPASFSPFSACVRAGNGRMQLQRLHRNCAARFAGESSEFSQFDAGGEKMRRWREFMREYGVTIAVSAATTVVFRLLLYLLR